MSTTPTWEELTKDQMYITDLGQEPEVELDGKMVTMGRYAVWAPIQHTNRHQVIEVGNDPIALADKHHIDRDFIFAVLDPMEMIHG